MSLGPSHKPSLSALHKPPGQPSGFFIVLEGIDGAGTTTQLHLVSKRLREYGLSVLETREPSDGAIGRFIRDRLRSGAGDELSMAALFAADRLEHVATEIRPALEAGHIVLCDRYVWSSYAYQAETVQDDTWVRQLNSKAPGPDLTVLVDVDAGVAAARRAARGGEVERYDDNALQGRLVTRYRALAASTERVLWLDGNEAKEELCEKICDAVLALRATPRPAG